MGRIKLNPLHVHRAATLSLAVRQRPEAPSWYSITADIPPAQTLIRTQPVQHQDSPRRARGRRKNKKPSRMFQPQRITYEEDRLRRDFFGDHPWELARPRVVLEDDGRDAERMDWSKLEQASRPIDGESVVQHQMHLQQHSGGLSPPSAYDTARKLFYHHRHYQDTQRRVAREEALSTGAQFNADALDIGMALENAEFERWKAWAEAGATGMEQARAAAYSGLGGQTGEGDAVEAEAEAAAAAAAGEQVPDGVVEAVEGGGESKGG